MCLVFLFCFFVILIPSQGMFYTFSYLGQILYGTDWENFKYTKELTPIFNLSLRSWHFILPLILWGCEYSPLDYLWYFGDGFIRHWDDHTLCTGNQAPTATNVHQKPIAANGVRRAPLTVGVCWHLFCFCLICKRLAPIPASFRFCRATSTTPSQLCRSLFVNCQWMVAFDPPKKNRKMGTYPNPVQHKT